MHYALNTFLQLEGLPFAARYVAGAAVCADGKVRSLRFGSGFPDAFFSIPCSVQVKGKTVSGYATVETLAGFSTASDSDPLAVKFIRYNYGKNAHMLPRGSFTAPKENPLGMWRAYRNAGMLAKGRLPTETEKTQ